MHSSRKMKGWRKGELLMIILHIALIQKKKTKFRRKKKKKKEFPLKGAAEILYFLESRRGK